MAKSANQKLKLLYLLEYLYYNTDDEHPVSTEKIISYIASKGVKAERKSIYSDIEALREYGFDIILTRMQPRGFYIGARNFEIPEMKLLIDAILSSQFITEKKTEQLLDKLLQNCSSFQKEELCKNIVLAGRIKNTNESIYYAVDKVNAAIAAQRQLSFLYFDYNLEKHRIYRHSGKQYFVSPFSLVWNDDRYYMIAYDSEAQMLKNYRVDRMDSVTVTDLPIDESGRPDNFDGGIYAQTQFRMFSGEMKEVDLEFDNSLVNAVIDRFGTDVQLHRINDERFTVKVKVAVSNQFLSWIISLGKLAKIRGPRDVRLKMKALLSDVLLDYN